MEASPNSQSFDLNSASVEALVERFPELGLFSAEDIVTWREKNGPITTIAPLVDELGLSEDVAVALLRVAPTDTMAPASGEFQTSLYPRPAPAEATVIFGSEKAPEEEPAKPAEQTVIFGSDGATSSESALDVPVPVPVPESPEAPEPVKAAEPEPEPIKAPEPEPIKAPEPEPEPEILGSEARLAARLGLEKEEPRQEDPRAPRAALERTGVNPVAAPSEPVIAVAAEPAHEPSEPPPEPKRSLHPAGVPARSKRSFVMPAIVALVVLANVGLGVFLLQVRKETQGVKAPVAALSGEMNGIKEEQAQAKEEMVEQKAKLDRQAKSLQKTIDRVDATEARQKEAERQAREAAKAEAKEVAALTARLGRVESRSEKASFRIDEAIKIIDSVQGKPGPTEDEAPAKKSRSKRTLDDVADTRK